MEWSPEHFAELAEEKIPPAYLTALQELGPEKILSLVTARPNGEIFQEANGQAQIWFYRAWKELFETGPTGVDNDEEELEHGEEGPPAADSSKVLSQSDLIGDSTSRDSDRE